MWNWLTGLFPLDIITTPIAHGYAKFMRMFRDRKKGKYGGEFRFPERSNADAIAFIHDCIAQGGVKIAGAWIVKGTILGPTLQVYFPDEENLKKFLYLYEHREFINP